LQVFRSFLLIRHFTTIRDGFLIHFLSNKYANKKLKAEKGIAADEVTDASDIN